MKQSVTFVKEIFENIKNSFEEYVEIIDKETIPENHEQLSLEVQRWIRVKNVVCVYIDLASSTKINIEENQKLAAHIFDSYINAVVKIFKDYQCKYIDIQGDGAFALFDGNDRINRAIVAAVTIKTLLSRNADYFSKFVSSKLNSTNLSLRIGIHQGNILAKKAGIRGDNEIVWLGDAVSIASKICNLKFYRNIEIESDTIRISDVVYKNIDNKHLLMSCGCGGTVTNLWEEYTFTEPFFGVSALYVLEANWCKKCGDTFSSNTLNNIER